MSNIASSFFGFVIGDAIGVPIEYETRSSLIADPCYEMIGYGRHNVPAGSWSESTSLTIATMKSIIEKKKINCSDLMDKFYKWYKKGFYTPDGNAFGIGRTTYKALKTFTKNRKKPLSCGISEYNNNSNDALARMLPIALYCYYHKIEEKDLIDIIRNVSSLTHAHEISHIACYIYIRYIMFLLQGQDKETAYQNIKFMNYEYFEKENVEKFSRLLENDITSLKLNEISSTNFVIDTLEAVFWVILNTENFAHAIVAAINLGGDTDAIGALTGSIAGIIYDEREIPNRWKCKLLQLDSLKKTIHDYEKILKEG